MHPELRRLLRMLRAEAAAANGAAHASNGWLEYTMGTDNMTVTKSLQSVHEGAYTRMCIPLNHSRTKGIAAPITTLPCHAVKVKLK
mmetsp:Transcript_21986/g.55977  ORF Transcript_21986/g.55977 Transcript_21986/m.55977 type:complete len:86 (+) Transcript_21986:831-1088(+)